MMEVANTCIRLNWTKVGLKVAQPPGDVETRPVEFELD